MGKNSNSKLIQQVEAINNASWGQGKSTRPSRTNLEGRRLSMGEF